jgi:hypothetical protein
MTQFSINFMKISILQGFRNVEFNFFLTLENHILIKLKIENIDNK